MHGHHAHAVAVFLEDRRFGRLRGVRRDAQLLDEAAERDPAAHLVLPRELGDVQHVGERLLAAGPEREADVRARGGEQLLQRSRDAARGPFGTALALPVPIAEPRTPNAELCT